MNLWLRLLCLLVTARRRGSIAIPHEASTLKFRVLPLDVDLSLHLNNGRYLALMDLGRLDIMLRTGLWRAVLRHRWTPVANALVIRFRREIRPFETFRLTTRILGWTESHIFMEQVFAFERGDRAGQVAARALFKGALYDRSAGAYVPVARLMLEIGEMAESPLLPPEVEALLAADEALRQGAMALSDRAAAGARPERAPEGPRR